MRKLTYIVIFIMSMVTLNSCLFDSVTTYDLNDDGPNLAGFADARTTFAAIADGEEYTFELRIKAIGPTIMDQTADVTITIAADAESSTAVEGTHFRIDNPQITLSDSNNYLGLFEVTMLTEGIVTPLDVSPVLVLEVTAASGNENILNNGKKLTITMNYACPSDLAGTYDVATVYTAYDATVYNLAWTENINEIGVGTYRTTNVGHWAPGDLAPGTPGYTFTDVCGVLTIPWQYLADYWGNEVEGTDLGSVDEGTGSLYMEYSICFGGNCRYYESTYVPQ